MPGDVIRELHRYIEDYINNTILDSRLTVHRFNVSHLRDKIIEQLIVNPAALGMILDSQSEGIIAQFHLLDDVIGRAPGLNFQTGTELIDCLVMRAIYFFKAMPRPAIEPQRLDVVRLLIRQVMASNVEMKGTAERDIESLQSFADRENRKPAFDRLLDCVEFPTIAVGIHIFLDYGWIGNRLVQEFGSDVWSAGE
jgi:hypothetical protein